MDGMMYIMPEEGMTIDHPDTKQPIGKEGAWVPNNRFYRRFIRNGEAKETDPPKVEEISEESAEDQLQSYLRNAFAENSAKAPTLKDIENDLGLKLSGTERDDAWEKVKAEAEATDKLSAKEEE
ncbi:DUF2635 domain-containing protein [Terasakiella sp. A23]|uniref:DUF2635 domain-containing protein n=1 Tax=Terasakiella sp. FCG-A23 TaxID=3080561 RepID=UPI0029531E63|nr:DUF2635 domain-containing protein [Terasakiella sp. A23]MDV7340973.1 DUF2635 domain-containing protein [Terasakiella sp. A23]